MATGLKTRSGRLAALGAALAVMLGVTATAVRAEADGPDYYRVRGVAANDVLHIRAEPDPHAARLGDIPHDGSCIRNLGCRGGLSFQEFTTLSKAEQAQRERANPRWCKIEYQGTVGWVAGRYLAEGDCN